MPRAILMSYAAGQNCPSQPDSKIHNIPDDKEGAEAYLTAYFIKEVCAALWTRVPPHTQR